MKKFYWSIALFALLFITAISTAYARDRFIAKQGENPVVFESLEDRTMLFKLLSPQGKVLWKYHLEDKGISYRPQYANGKIYQLALLDRKFVINLYTIEVGGNTTSREIVGSGTKITQEGVFYNKNEEKSIYFSPYSDLDSEIVYTIPNSKFLRRAYSTGDYHIVAVGDGNFRETIYVLQGEKILDKKTLPKYSGVTGIEQIGKFLFFFEQSTDNFYYLHAYNLQKKSFWVKQVKPNKGSLYLAFISPKGDGYVLYGSYTGGAFEMELNAGLEVLGSKLYQRGENQYLEYIEQKAFLWDEEKSKAIPLEDLPVEKFKMWLS